jgi:hypothetical protein
MFSHAGVSLSNIAGRLMEVETDFGSTLTDEWFSYDADGRPTDTYESSSPTGSKLGLFQAQAVLQVFVPLPGAMPRNMFPGD